MAHDEARRKVCSEDSVSKDNQDSLNCEGSIDFVFGNHSSQQEPFVEYYEQWIYETIGERMECSLTLLLYLAIKALVILPLGAGVMPTSLVLDCKAYDFIGGDFFALSETMGTEDPTKFSAPASAIRPS